MILLPLVAGAVVVSGSLGSGPSGRPLASIRLFNSTAWASPTTVEVPTGRLASPGLIDWRHVRLVADGREVPFALREGKPHWKAGLVAPVRSPRAEDLLVFDCAVAPSKWLQVDILPGAPAARSAMRRRAGRLVVSYPGLTVSVDEASGRLLGIRPAGVSFLPKPMAVNLWRVSLRPVRPGEFGPGPDAPVYEPKREVALASPTAKLVASSSTRAMTELHFVFRAGNGLALALTYRIHASGLVEICSDERPWTGKSPWVDRAVDYRLELAGEAEAMLGLANRAPFYGFKDYNAVVRHVGTIHRLKGAALVELGEETTNGRRWNRRLFVAAPGKGAGVADAVDVLDEGLVVETVPLEQPWTARTARIACAADDRAAAEKLAGALGRVGVRSAIAGPRAKAGDIAFSVVTDPAKHRISGDGFAVQPGVGGGVSVVAGTRFGLVQAACRIAEQLDARAHRAVGVPIIAANPAVDFRSAGPGGGDFEVDFPYGDDAEWEHVFDGLIDSGMNAIADLGMWSNWKMPVSYRYMPELRSSAPDAYDEVSGARFAEFDQHRARGLKLMRYLHDRGVKVWLWLPIGAVPTTYAAKHPEAMSPKNAKVPCFTHPLYARYLKAFLKELLETYPIDGIVMIRDDNGGICDCERCQAYLAKSRTHSPVWEQYLILYDYLRKAGFSGGIGVYPYFDHYDAHLDPLLPSDLDVMGHGAGVGVLSRSFEHVAPMGDTWIDNLFASFRLPGSARMKRLLSDRGSFWLGGAYRGTELPWEAIGRFGWEPTETVNTFRYEWGRRTFGVRGAVPFVRLNAAYERLWELNDVPMLPLEWFKGADADRRYRVRYGEEWVGKLRERLAALRSAAGPAADDGWFLHVALFGSFVDANLHRLQWLSEMRALYEANRSHLDDPSGLPPAVRERFLALHAETYRDADELGSEAARVPGHMISRTLGMLKPYKEWGMQPYGWYLEERSADKQFAGTIAAPEVEAEAGKPFVLRVELHNRGYVPWMPPAGQRLELGGDRARLGLPERWYYEGDPMAPGDRRVVELRGVAPAGSGDAEVTLAFYPPFNSTVPTMQATAKVRWRPGR